MARTRGGSLGAQSRPRGRPRGRGAQANRMGIVERVESANSGDIPRNKSLSEASVSNKRSDGHVCGTKSGQSSSMSRTTMLNFNILR